MLGIAADLPDALIGIARMRDGVVDQARQPFPHRLDDLRRALAEVDVDGVEDHAPHVVLVLVPGAVAHPHRPRIPPARQVVEGLLGQVLATVDAVHDLQVEVATAGHRLEHEGEVLEGLPVEPEPVERAQHEGGVTDPGVAVVPVARPAGRLGQRGRRRRHDGAGGRVAQSLERQRAALDVAAPGVVRKIAVGEPVPPVGDRGGELGLRVLHVDRPVAGPGQRDEGRLPLVQRRAAVAAGAGRAQAEAGGHGEHRVAGRWADRHDLVAVPVVVPHARLDSVFEDGHSVDLDLDVAFDAGGQSQEGARGGGVARRPAVVGSPCPVRHRLDRPRGPPPAASPSGCATWFRAPWSRGRSAGGAARGCRWARSGSCRPCGRAGRQRCWGNRAAAGTATRRSRPGPRDSCSRSPRGTHSRRSRESSQPERQWRRLRSRSRC